MKRNFPKLLVALFAVILCAAVAVPIVFAANTAPQATVTDARPSASPSVPAYYATSDDILHGPTGELLEFFLGTELVTTNFGLLSSTLETEESLARKSKPDFSRHTAFIELQKRDDLAEVLNDKLAEFVLTDTSPTLYTKAGMRREGIFLFLNQDATQERLAEDEKSGIYPFLAGACDYVRTHTNPLGAYLVIGIPVLENP